MAQRLDRRPGEKAGLELPQERLARQKLDGNLDARTQEAKRALEKAQGGQEVDAEAAAQLQRSLGNAALQSMVKGSSDTDTSTTSAEATLDKAREEEQEEDQEQDEDKEAGEIEHVLPSFSTGGGGAGAPGGTSPWATHMFGGDGDGDDEEAGPARPRWRPMPVPPDPDDDVELDELVADVAHPEAAAISLEEADELLGSLPWTPGTLARGLRHPARLVGRRVMGADNVPDPVWGRARAALRFQSVHAPADSSRALAAGAAAIGTPESAPLVLALAQELALLDATLAALDPAWLGVVDAAADQRARVRTEAAAASLPVASLSAATLLAHTLDARAEPANGEPAERAHPAALAALSLAARVEPLPHVEPWHRPVVSTFDTPEDAELAALDAVLADFTGGDTSPLPPLDALYAQLDAALTALGALQVECASAALAAWPWLPDGVAEAAMHELDDHVRRLARRLVAAGRTIEAAAARDDAGGVEQASAEAASIASVGAFARDAALAALAGPLLPADAPAAPPPDDTWQHRMSAGRTDLLRAALSAEDPLIAFARRAQLDGASAAGDALTGVPGDAALLQAATLASVGDLNAAAYRVAGWVGEGRPGPYGLVWAAILTAFAKQDSAVLLAAAPTVHATGEAGALNLLKAAWTELRAIPPRMPAPALNRLSYAEYLQIEESSELRHEFYDGVILAMAGGSGAHARLKANLTGLLHAALRGRPCSVRDVDQRVRVPVTGLATYPDLSVVCGARQPDAEDRHALTNPTLLAEVLWPSTAAYDRGEKFDQYQYLPSLRQYLLVDSERRHVDVYTLLPDGRWAREGFASGPIPLLSIDVTLDFGELYLGWEEERAIDAGSEPGS